MTAIATPAHVPAVEAPRHPLGALATFELAGYRRQLQNAIAFFDAQHPVPRSGPTCKPGSTPC